MSYDPNENVTKILSTLDPKIIPHNFVCAGQILEASGNEVYLDVFDVIELVENQEEYCYEYQMSSLKLIIDMDLVKDTILYHYHKIMCAFN